MSAATTFAPSEANLSALALPIPPAAPVTMATLLLNRISFSLILGVIGALAVRPIFLSGPEV
jgi:hypothetical protein